MNIVLQLTATKRLE